MFDTGDRLCHLVSEESNFQPANGTEECQRRCVKREACEAFIFAPSTRLCFLIRFGLNGTDASDFQTFTCILETCVIFVVSLQLAMDTNYWTALNHFFLWGSVAMFFLFLFMMYSNTIYSLVPNMMLFVGVARNTYVCGGFEVIFDHKLCSNHFI